MKIGVNTAIWPLNTENSVKRLFNNIKAIGFDAIEMAIEDRSRNHLDLIKENLIKSGLQGILCSAFINGNLLDENKNNFNKGMDYVKDSIDICEFLNMDTLIGPVFGSLINKDFLNPVIKNKAFSKCVYALKEIGEYALLKNIKIAIEPLNRYDSNFINTVEEGLELIKKVNLYNIGLNLDTYHMNIEEKNLVEAIKKAGKHVFHLHFSENDRGTLGTGHVPFGEIANIIKELKFDGFIVMECGSPLVKDVATLLSYWRVYDYSRGKMVIDGLKFLKKILNQ